MYSESIVFHNAAIAELVLNLLFAIGLSAFCIGVVITVLRHSRMTRAIFTIKRARINPRDYSRRNKRLSSY